MLLLLHDGKGLRVPPSLQERMAREDELRSSDQPESEPVILEGEECPVCGQRTLTLMELERDIPYFGRVRLYSMTCQNPQCRFSTSDVDILEAHEPSRYTLRVENEEDLKARVVKSSTATVKIGRLGSIEPVTRSPGYVSNIEGVLRRFERQVRFAMETAEEREQREKAKRMLKKLQRILQGSEPVTITIEDPQGNSAIISPKAKKESLVTRKGKKRGETGGA